MRRSAFFLLIFSCAGFLVHANQNAGVSRPPSPSAGENLAPQPLAIVVNTANPISRLTTAELRKVFLGERGHWPNGRRITIVMLEPGQPERKVILSDVCQMNETEFNNHFLHGLFTGEVLVSPKTLANPLGVRKFIFNVPGAIGYLRLSDVDDTVKVIRIGERAPSDKGYPLRIAAVK